MFFLYIFPCYKMLFSYLTYFYFFYLFIKIIIYISLINFKLY